MMDCTDSHYRYLARLISQHVLLYTEMVTTGAVIHGDRAKLLKFSHEELPLAIQLGGSDPKALAESAFVAAQFGYDEVNLNVGCPSDRVQAGRFGACLMKEPQRVADCVAAMRERADISVTVKTRLGVDDLDSYQVLMDFVGTVAEVGCDTFIIHARKAWLKGLSPRQNRDIPPLCYDRVYRLKQDMPALTIGINGGIKTCAEITEHLRHVDSVMIGREAYANPWLLASFDQEFFGGRAQPASIKEIILRYLPYVAQQLNQGVRLRSLVRHLVGLFHGYPGARRWRRYLSENAGRDVSGVKVIEDALEFVKL